MRKKTEKLRKYTREVEQELADLEMRRKAAKRAAREEADGTKADFLRQAAIVQRKVDEHNGERQMLRDAIERDRPELNELRQRMSDQAENQRERRATLERERAARLAALEDEIVRLDNEL